MKLKLAVCLLLCAVSLHAQTFQAFVTRVNNAPAQQRSAIIDSFLNAAGTFPYREQDTLCHFIYRGNVNRVNVPGDANGWNGNAFPMTRLATTDFFYHTHTFEADARLDYKFSVNGSGNWILDPRNPYQVSGGFGPNSELRMPGYVPAPEIESHSNIPHGALRDTSFFSTNLNNSRTIRVYTPPFYNTTTARYPVVLFHDGLEFISLAKANNVLDYLIAQQRLDPVIAVFVPPYNPTVRHQEYATTLQNQFTAFIAQEVMPWVDRRYRTRTDAASRAVLGSSDGGNISLWLGYAHPEIFGNVAALSSNAESNVISGYQNSPRLNLKLYLDMGTYDLAILIARLNALLPILTAKGYTFQYLEWHEGHSWGNWRAHLDNALEYFFPGPALRVAEGSHPPQNFKIAQSHPNPFQHSTMIKYEVERPVRVQISIYNLLGQLVAILADQNQTPGNYTVVWNGENARGQPQPSGIYFYRVQYDGRTAATRRIVLMR
ncbi:T9SS type A sorting domain-containing protein [candidate division KSB1 bacterium]|nr:T9SS type A sorting domain-containing protein [candidate division KSB1 bacterium]